MHALFSVTRRHLRPVLAARGDTAVALLTAVLMVSLYYANTRAQSTVFFLVVFVILTNGVLNVLFPVYYLLVVRGGAKPAGYHEAMVVASLDVVGDHQRALLASAPTRFGAAAEQRPAAPVVG